MHELSLATELIEQVEQAARTEGARRVVSVEVEIGALSGVEIEAFAFCFPLAAEGTVIEGARLEIEQIPVRVHCGACDAETAPVPPGLACGTCGSLAVELLSGKDFRLRAIEVN